MLFNINPLKSTEQVRREVNRIVGKQKIGSDDDLTASAEEIERLLSHIEFKADWKKLPVVARAAMIDVGGTVVPFSEDIVLPNTKHDLELVIKMLNYLREQKKLSSVKMPIFVQPDEISLAHTDGKFPHSEGKILSQISLVLQKGAIMYVGFVFDRNYVILEG